MLQSRLEVKPWEANEDNLLWNSSWKQFDERVITIGQCRRAHGSWAFAQKGDERGNGKQNVALG